jgi:excisionase family DNA binding protein
MRAAIPLAEAARELGVSVVQVRRLVRCGELPHARVGRRVIVLSDDLLEFLRGRRVAPARRETKPADDTASTPALSRRRSR